MGSEWAGLYSKLPGRKSSEVICIRHRLPLPARRDADIGKAEHSFDRRPFSDVVAFDHMAGVLQQIAKDERGHTPVPGQEKEQE